MESSSFSNKEIKLRDLDSESLRRFEYHFHYV
jgi:hypothetical protein